MTIGSVSVSLAVSVALVGMIGARADASSQAAPAGAGTANAKEGAPAAPKPADEKPKVVFDHSEGKARIFDLDLNHGQRFIVRIDKTCPAAFDYSHEGIERGTFSNQAKKGLELHDIPVVYDQQYGGYVFHITQKKDVKPGELCEGGENLTSQSFVVSVRQQKWNVAFSGAFTLSNLNDPIYSIKTENGVKKVQEEPSKQNVKKLGAASFVHLFHDGIQWKGLQPALGFGLGINSDNKTEYMIGGALRFGDKATVNIGAAWGSIARLPNGVTFDTPVTDDNLLSNLGQQTVKRFFVAFGYSFIDTKDRLTKPFAPDTAKAGGDGGSGAGGGAETAANDSESGAALTAAAASVETYAGVAALKAVLQPTAGTKTICSAVPTKPVNSALELTVNVKGATNDELTALNKEQDAAAKAVAAAAKAALKKANKALGITIGKLTFAAACS